jgi:hypothetical protein
VTDGDRRERRRTQHDGPRRRSGRPGGAARPDPAALADRLIAEAVHARARADDPGFSRCAAELTELGDLPDRRMLDRVRALLAKAESTEFPKEAEALSARAQELMARHRIDRALLAAASGGAGEPSGRRLAVDSPYEAPKTVLLDVVATANGCRLVWHRSLGLCTVLGFPGDLDAVELLFTSLLAQATAAMVHAGPSKPCSPSWAPVR